MKLKAPRIGARVHLALAEIEHIIAAGNFLPHGLVRIERVAALVHIAKLHAVADLDLARIGLFLARQHAEQGGLARAIGADDADNAAGRQLEGEVLDEQPVAIGLVQALHRDDIVAEPLARRNDDLRRGRFQPLVVGLDQFVIGLEAGLGFGLPRLGRGGNPFLLALDHLLPRRILALFLGIAFGLLAEIGGIIALIGNAAAAVEFKDPARHIVEEVAVMGHDED